MSRSGSDPLAAVRHAHAAARDAEADLAEAVLAARAAGRTWQEIGEVLDVSRQAAFKRFGRPVDPETGRVLATGPLLDAASVAEEAFRLLAEGRVEDLRDRMTHACARALTRSRLQDVWRDVLASVGELESCSGHEARGPDGTRLGDGPLTGPVVGRIVLHHEVGDLAGHVSINRAGRIDGLVVVPLRAEGTLPF